MDISFHFKDLYISVHRSLSKEVLNQHHAHYWTGDHTEKVGQQQAFIAISSRFIAYYIQALFLTGNWMIFACIGGVAADKPLSA